MKGVFGNSRLAGKTCGPEKKKIHTHTHIYMYIYTYIYAYIHMREKARERVCQKAFHVSACMYFFAGHM